MDVQSDVYLKLGDEKADSQDEIWRLYGDSDDATHSWWHELRSCDFGVERDNPGKAGGGNGSPEKKSGTKELEPVTLVKRVDWSSPALFSKCCVAYPEEEQDKDGKPRAISKVRVEVCRTAGGVKFAFIIVEYSDVRVLSYDVAMDQFEPVETLKLKVTSFRYGFRATNPYTGMPLTAYDPKNPDAGVQWGSTKTIEDEGGGQSSDQQEDEQGTSSDDGAAPAAAAAGIATAASLGGSSGGSGSLSVLVSTHDAAVSANFPGLWEDNGFGLLPD